MRRKPQDRLATIVGVVLVAGCLTSCGSSITTPPKPGTGTLITMERHDVPLCNGISANVVVEGLNFTTQQGGAEWRRRIRRGHSAPRHSAADFQSDAAYGVRDSAANGRYSTAMPSNLGAASSWDPDSACAYGTVIAQELRAQGSNMTLVGGVDLVREPRNGRTFEYTGEDPLLAGTMAGSMMKCEQAQHVVGDIKHYAMNDQETARNFGISVISKKAMQESDLLAFHIAISIAKPGAVMCSYNRINSVYACENPYTLHDVLKDSWGFKGFVLSDWGGTHSTVAASATHQNNSR